MEIATFVATLGAAKWTFCPIWPPMPPGPMIYAMGIFSIGIVITVLGYLAVGGLSVIQDRGLEGERPTATAQRD